MKRKGRVLELKEARGAKPAGGKEGRSQRGFTLVELMIALAISVIIAGGMIGFMAMSFDMFSTSRAQQALNDSSRKALSTMVRQLKCTLGLNSTDLHEIGFYGDVTGEYPQANKNNVKEYIDDPGEHEQPAPLVEFFLKEGDDHIWQKTTKPDAPTEPEEVVIASNVDTVNFYYYSYGAVPDLDDLEESSIQPPTEAISKKASLVVIELKMTNGKMTRTYRQDVIFRALDI